MWVHRRILVVEDDAALRASVGEALRGDGHDVETVANGAAAYERLRTSLVSGRRLPEVLVIDHHAGGASALDTMQLLRDIGCEMFVFVTTADADEATREEAYRLGVLEVFDEPLDLGELRGAIRKIHALS